MFVVESWMARNVVTVRPDAKIIEAFELMQTHRIRHLPVVEDETLTGLVTDRDIRLALIPSPLGNTEERVYHLGALTRVDEIMATDLVTVTPRTTVEAAAKLMAQDKIGALPVVEHERLVGILTETDIVHVFLEMLAVIQSSSRIDLVLGEKPGALDEVTHLFQQNHVKVISVSMSPEEPSGSPVYSFRIERSKIEPLVKKLEQAGYRVVEALE